MDKTSKLQIADENNICYNIMDPDPLASLCQSFIDSPGNLALSSTNRLVAGCCQDPYVPVNQTVCGPDSQLPPMGDLPPGLFVSIYIMHLKYVHALMNCHALYKSPMILVEIQQMNTISGALL